MRQQQAVQHRAGGERPHRARHPAARSHLRLRAHRWRGGHHQGRKPEQERASWPRRCQAARRSWCAPSRPSRLRSRPCKSWPPPQGKRFAVIADEAHSSQTGEAAGKLKQVLSAEELQRPGRWRRGGHRRHPGRADGAKASMAGTASAITYVAFTATPKAKTLELFGRRPNPDLPAGPDNLPAPFHVYSMRQAIEEGFILDVLKNYTSYKLAFKLAHNGKGVGRQGGGAQRSPQGPDALGAPAPLQHRPEGAGGGGALPGERAALLKGHAKAMVVVAAALRLCAGSWRSIELHPEGRLPAGHAGGLFRRGERPEFAARARD